MTTQALLLNADYTPLKVISWERAINLIMDETAELVEKYSEKMLHSVTDVFEWPAVIRLFSYVKPRARIRFNRRNVLARDSYKCCYCGIQPVNKAGHPKLEELTIDHVVPRAQSRDGKVRLKSDRIVPVTSWENVVCACESCNIRKADRTPDQARMKLLREPRVPNMSDVLVMSLKRYVVPDEWTAWLPEGAAEWGGYWDSELESD